MDVPYHGFTYDNGATLFLKVSDSARASAVQVAYGRMAILVPSATRLTKEMEALGTRMTYGRKDSDVTTICLDPWVTKFCNLWAPLARLSHAGTPLSSNEIS